MIETPYLVLEWLDGTTLDKELKKRRGTRMPLEEAAQLLSPPRAASRSRTSKASRTAT